MGLVLRLSEVCVPGFVKKPELERLFRATADAFQVSTPSIRGLPFHDSLAVYAQFTRDWSDWWIRQGRTEQVKSRLFENAYRMGSEYRTRFGLGTMEQVMRASRVIYRLLRIDFRGEETGDVTISHCFFSDYYSSDVCRLVSALDEGLLAGLSGGGRLEFSQRITEGSTCCRAYLGMKGG